MILAPHQKIMIISRLVIKSVVDVGNFTWSSISKFPEDNPRDVSFIWNAWHQAPLLLKLFSFQFTEYFSCLNYINWASAKTQKLMILLLLRYASILQSTLTVQLYRQGLALYIEGSVLKLLALSRNRSWLRRKMKYIELNDARLHTDRRTGCTIYVFV